MTRPPTREDIRAAIQRLGALQALAAPCVCDRVIDGDTLVVTARFDLLGVDLQLGSIHVRLLGVDAPELPTPGGVTAKLELSALVLRSEDPPQLRVVAAHADKYGRALGTVTVDGVDVIQTGLAAGWLRPYDGSGPRPWPATWPTT